MNSRAHAFVNAIAVRGALWWLRQSHSVNYANHEHSPDGATPIVQFLAPKKIIWGPGPSPHLGTALQTPFSPLSFTINFHENPFSRSRERLSHKLWWTEKAKKTDCKTYTHSLRLASGCVNSAHAMFVFIFGCRRIRNEIPTPEIRRQSMGPRLMASQKVTI